MKVYLWKHRDGIFLLNEDFTKFCRPYFITHPQRTLLLKARYNGDFEKDYIAMAEVTL